MAMWAFFGGVSQLSNAATTMRATRSLFSTACSIGRCHDTCLESMGRALERLYDEHGEKPENEDAEDHFDSIHQVSNFWARSFSGHVNMLSNTEHGLDILLLRRREQLFCRNMGC